MSARHVPDDDRFDDPETVSYDRYEIDMHDKSVGAIEREMDAIFLLKMPVTVKTESQGFNKERARADDGFSRTTAIDTRSTLLRDGLGDGDYLVYWISGPAGARAEQFGQETFTVSGSTPCVADSPATPPAETCLADPPSGAPGTAIESNGISVTLQVSGDKAGPVDLSATVTDTTGTPVEGATVVFRARHLEMNHGELPYLAAEIAPGVYEATGVGMGMGGGWRVAVDVTLPDQPPVTVFVEQTMVE